MEVNQLSHMMFKHKLCQRSILTLPIPNPKSNLENPHTLHFSVLLALTFFTALLHRSPISSTLTWFVQFDLKHIDRGASLATMGRIFFFFFLLEKLQTYLMRVIFLMLSKFRPMVTLVIMLVKKRRIISELTLQFAVCLFKFKWIFCVRRMT